MLFFEVMENVSNEWINFDGIVLKNFKQLH